MSLEVALALLAAVPLYMVVTGYVMYVVAGRAKTPDDGDRPRLFFVLVIAALNEELVIGHTIRHLLSLKASNFLIFVVNDDSDDRTASVVESFQSDRVRLSSRHLPLARQGKGAVLNHAYHAILTSELPELYGMENIVMTVLDADCEVEPNFLRAVSPYFDDAKTAGVQTGVRMMNGHDNLVTLWQQCEFTTFNWVFSRAHETLGSASLGGNGQFVRLSALASLGGMPWTDCLTEDLDIGLRLAVRGWRNHYVHTTRVHQQAVSSLRPLLRQRSRWFQGHVSCWKHVPAVWTSKLSAWTKLDILNYLLAPALIIPLGIFSMVSLAVFVFGLASPLIPGMNDVDRNPGAWAAWLLLGLGTAPLCVLALVRDRQASPLRAIPLALLYVLGGYIWFVAGAVALWRGLQRSGGWLKTGRTPVLGRAEGLAALASRPSSRYLAATTPVLWLEESRQLLPIRTQNFLPRHKRLELTGSLNYDTNGSAGSHVDGPLLMARGQAQMARVQAIASATRALTEDRWADREPVRTGLPAAPSNANTTAGQLARLPGTQPS